MKSSAASNSAIGGGDAAPRKKVGGAPRRRVSPSDRSALGAYEHDLRQCPPLTRQDELRLALLLSKNARTTLEERLVTSNLRLVVKIAQEYRRTRNDILDLIQEGNIGLIRAAGKYDPHRGVKFSSYASWWIRAYILKFVLANWRLVRVGTTQSQRRLFFNLHKERRKLENRGVEVEAKHLAAALDVTEAEVVEMERRLNISDLSLDAPARSREPGDTTAGDLMSGPATLRPDRQVEADELGRLVKLKVHEFGTTLHDRDLDIFQDRLLNDEPTTLVALAKRFGVTRERARQLEHRLKGKLRRYIETELKGSGARDVLSDL